MGNSQPFSNQISAKDQSKPRIYLFFNFLKSRSLKSTTWIRDSHGLFDYESKNTFKGEMKVFFSGNLIYLTSGTLQRNQNNEVKLTTPGSIVEGKPLLDIQQQNGEYFLNQTNTLPSPNSNSEGTHEDCAWKIMKNHKTKSKKVSSLDKFRL